MAPRIRYNVPDLRDLSRPQRHIKVRLADGDYGWTWDSERPDEFYSKSLHLERLEDDLMWTFKKRLGKGSFGLVGLWEKRNNQGEIVDRVAVKEQPMRVGTNFRLTPDGSPVPQEIIIQTTLQKKCVPVMQVRAMKVITVSYPEHEEIIGRTRCYAEFCPNGDLGGIFNYYRANDARSRGAMISGASGSAECSGDLEHCNRDDTEKNVTQSRSMKHTRPQSLNLTDPKHRRIPETFFWHLLYNFAQVMIAMETPPFDHPNERNVGQQPFVLHLDVKLNNIMLGEADDEDTIKGYPSIKVGDWGLAEVTSINDPGNSQRFYNNGAPSWHPPEQREGGTFGSHWDEPPPWRNHEKFNRHAYTPAHSVFAFASIIFRLMTLDDPENARHGRLPELLREADRDEREVRNRNFKYISAEVLNKNFTYDTTGYSFKLRDLIADCLKLDPAMRPTAQQLEGIAREECSRRAGELFTSGQSIFTDLYIPEPDHNVGW